MYPCNTEAFQDSAGLGILLSEGVAMPYINPTIMGFSSFLPLALPLIRGLSHAQEH